MLLLSTNLTLKSKLQRYYFPMDFENLTLDGLIDTGALTSAISDEDFKKSNFLKSCSDIALVILHPKQ